MLTKGSYFFQGRYFAIQHYGIVFLQRRFRNYIKKKFFKQLKFNQILKELLTFFYSPPQNNSPIQIYRKGGPRYIEISIKY